MMKLSLKKQNQIRNEQRLKTYKLAPRPISCYRCKATGTAFGRKYKVKTRQGLLDSMLWACKAFKRIGTFNTHQPTSETEKWLCDKCNKDRCEICDILLGNIVCRCEKIHGKRKGQLCLECYKEI